MNRADLRRLSALRLKEAKVLLRAGEWAGAYYLAGYSVECGLKACIAKATRRAEFPDKRRAEGAWKHDPTLLIAAAGLKTTREDEERADIDFATAWAVVKDWSESSRYEFANQQQAQALLEAIDDPDHGVMKWLTQHW